MTEENISVAVDAGDFCIGKDEVNSGITRLLKGFFYQIKKNPQKNIHYNVYYFSSKKAKNTPYTSYKKLPRTAFGSLWLPYEVLKDRNDLFLGFSSHIPRLLSLSKIKKIVFLYDLGFYTYPAKYNNSYRLARMTNHSLKCANTVVTLSKYMKKVLIALSSQYSKKIQVVYPGTDHLERLKSKKDRKYFLYVGVIKPTKNIEELLLNFGQFLQKSSDKNYKLLLIGKKEGRYFARIKQNPIYKKLKRNISFVGKVSDQQLSFYYSHATAILNLSHEEGFGFPVFEALSLGKLAIVNNRPIYHEFKNKFKNLVITKNSSEVVRTMLLLTKNKNNLRTKKISKELTWKHFANQLVQLFFTA